MSAATVTLPCGRDGRERAYRVGRCSREFVLALRQLAEREDFRGFILPADEGFLDEDRPGRFLVPYFTVAGQVAVCWVARDGRTGLLARSQATAALALRPDDEALSN